MRVDGSQEVVQVQGWNGTSWGSRTNDPTEGGNGGSIFHAPLEKHKPAGANDIVYCWVYVGDRATTGSPAAARPTR